MLKKHLSTLDAAMQRRVLSKWNLIADRAEAMTLSTLRDLEADARRLDRSLDRFLRTAQSRLASPHIGSNAFKLPNRTDWQWRPYVWRVPITPAGATGFESGTYLDEHTRIFHDCRSSELAFRQMRNSEPGDLAAYAIRLEAFGFDGRFLSIAIELPEGCLQTLSKRHILRLDARIDSDRPLTVFARPNLMQGPNTEQALQAVSPRAVE